MSVVEPAVSSCDWIAQDRADASDIVSLKFVLPYTNPQWIHQELMEVSDPGSPRYRQYRSEEEIMKKVGPDAGSWNQTNRFLTKRFSRNGKTRHEWSKWGHHATLVLSVAEAESLLETECHYYEYMCMDGATGLYETDQPQKRAIKTKHTHFPDFELAKHLAFIGGATRFPLVRAGGALAGIEKDTRPLFLTNEKNGGKMYNSADGNDAEVEAKPLVPPVLVREVLPLRLRESALGADDDVPNPVQAVQPADQSVTFQVALICPDYKYLAQLTTRGSVACNQGGYFHGMRVRTLSGDGPQVNKVVNPMDLLCSLLQGDYVVCRVTVALANNFNRYAFGLDLLYTGGEFIYNLQHYIVGDPVKKTMYLKQYYGVPLSLVATENSTYQAVAAMKLGEFRGFYNGSDLQYFYAENGVDEANIDLVSMVGDKNEPLDPDFETQLDIQWISGMAPGARSAVWHSREAPNDDRYPNKIIDVIEQIKDSHDKPQVLSFSYGGPEVVFPDEDLQHMEEGFALLGTLGVTIIAASGDTGAYMSSRSHGICDRFEPSYPACSRYVTSVGATQLVAQNTTEGTCEIRESVCSSSTGAGITSGGGFSNRLSRRDCAWQEGPVEGWLANATYKPTPGSFNPNNRGYPDLAIFGHLFNMVHENKVNLVDGTSASAPAFAGMVSLINDQLSKQGQPPVGFLNPTLYSIAKEHPEVDRLSFCGVNPCLFCVCTLVSSDFSHSLAQHLFVGGIFNPPLLLVFSPQTFYDVKHGSNECLRIDKHVDKVCCSHGYHATTGKPRCTHARNSCKIALPCS